MTRTDPAKRERAALDVLELLPYRWALGPTSYDPGIGRWSYTARGPHPGRGKMPETDKATFKAFQRGTGTLAGALAGTALLAVTTSEPVILVAMLVAAFFTVVFYSANYTIYAFFLTAVIVFYEWFATGEQVGAGGQRLLAAVIGVALAIVGIGLMTRLRAAQTHLAD